ncbi:MAG: methyltransferase [Moorea sp. SIO1F2]|uniref:KR prefix domain-containing protein n=1 Tax=Moorena sp. SIO1F2 TaxID=2607819 RepID=UPI0013B9AB29|nr:methyltransferase [Moorena sp. SIO1F2]NET81434.1 methyltransferase [Moorena sp. SIO1F2]
MPRPISSNHYGSRGGLNSWSQQPSSQATSQFSLTPEQLPIYLGPTVLVDDSPGIEVFSVGCLPQDSEEVIGHILAQAWCGGSSIDWAAFQGDAAPRRVPLPTYPFDRQRYWAKPAGPIVAKSVHTPIAKPITPLPLSKQPDLGGWFYRPHWEQKLPLAPVSPATIAQRGEFWLLFLDDCSIGDGFARYLREAEIGVATVKLQPGAEFKALSDWDYCLNPDRAQHYRDLFQILEQRHSTPQQICHFGSVTAPETEPNPEVVFNSLLFLVQALGPQATANLIIISTNLHGIEPSDLPCPAKALVLGPALVIPQEYAKINCRSLDIELPKNELQKQNLLDRILAEAVAPEEDAVIAYREETRLARTYKSLQLPESSNDRTEPRLRQGGVYLIAGGLGGVGLTLATFLAKYYAGKIALLTRSSFPDRDSWEGILKQKRLPDLSSSIEELRKVEAKLSDQLAIAAISDYPGLTEKLTDLCCAHGFNYVKTAFVQTDSSQSLSYKAILESLRVLPELEGCVLYILDLLMAAEIISYKDGLYYLGAKADRVKEPEELSANLRRHYPDFRGLVELLDHCAIHYSAALTGKIPAISVLYPEGRSDFLAKTMENTIEHSREPIYRQVAAELVAKLASQQQGRPLRILEVGAGNGLLTEVVASALKQLEGVECEYWATDISPTFVEQLKQRSQEWGFDFIETKVFDISDNPLDWGFKLGHFDIILALNVVHATPQIESTLFNLQSLLVPSGTLVLVEATHTPPWVDMVWGLSKGWWQFEDRHLRQRSPLLSQSTWETLLREQGFALVESLPQDSKNQAATDTALIIAQFPARAGEAWDREADPEEITRHRIRRLLEIEQLGGQVQVLTADIGDRDALQTQIATV